MITLDDLADGVLLAIRGHAVAAYPRECCGVVIDLKGRLMAFAGRNVAADAAHAFEMHPADRLLVEQQRRLGHPVVAIYHSHCDGPALFSDKDREYAAAWPDVLHLVLAVTARGVLGLHGYRADGTLVDEPVEADA